MVFGFSHFQIGSSLLKKASRKTLRLEAPLAVVESRTPAQIYDLAHQRRLRALHFYIEKGYPLNVAARMVDAAQ